LGSKGTQSAAGFAAKSIVAPASPAAVVAVVPPWPAAGVPPVTSMSRIIPASLWPGTVHHACVVSCMTPREVSSVAPGSSRAVPVSPPWSLRSWDMAPLLVTFTMSSVPAGTVTDDGLT
jgi:hypothetical protein